MGKNMDSLKKYLPDRDNLILSTSITLDETHGNNIVKSFQSIEDVNEFCEKKNYDDVGNWWS